METQGDIRRLYLEDLVRRMRETSAEANRFAGRFLFGGLVAAIATINADLVFTALSTYETLGVGATAVLLALAYFVAIRVRIERLEAGYQKSKYLYEVVVNSVLMGVDDSTLAKLMEDWRLEKEPKLGELPTNFERLLSQLHERHGGAFGLVGRRGRRQYVVLPMIVVVLALIIKGAAVCLEVASR